MSSLSPEIHEHGEHTHDDENRQPDRSPVAASHEHAHDDHAHALEIGDHAEPDHGHSHAEHSGWRDWIPFVGGHSHAGPQTDSALETSEKGIWAVKISLLGLG